MKYSKEDIEVKIIELLEENGEMRFGKIAKTLIHSGMAQSSFIVLTVLQNGCKDHKDFRGNDLFLSEKTGYWKLSKDNINEN